jgi:hypothetical protein
VSEKDTRDRKYLMMLSLQMYVTRQSEFEKAEVWSMIDVAGRQRELQVLKGGWIVASTSAVVDKQTSFSW